MKSSFFALLIAASAMFTFAGEECPPHPWCETANLRTWCEYEYPSISGVSIGTSLIVAKKVLGNPAIESTPRYSDTFGVTVIDLEYEGLVLEAIRYDGEELFTVTRIDSSSSKWIFSQGPTVGNLKKQVLKVLGQPDRISANGETEILTFYLCPNDVRTLVSVKNGIVTGVLMWFDWV